MSRARGKETKGKSSETDDSKLEKIEWRIDRETLGEGKKKKKENRKKEMKQVGRDLGHWHSTCERKSRRSLGQSSGSTRKHMRVTCRR